MFPFVLAASPSYTFSHCSLYMLCIFQSSTVRIVNSFKLSDLEMLIKAEGHIKKYIYMCMYVDRCMYFHGKELLCRCCWELILQYFYMLRGNKLVNLTLECHKYLVKCEC